MEKAKTSEIKAKLGNFVKVNPIYSPYSKSGDAVRNQVEIVFENGTAFQSYGTFIGAKINGQLYLTENHTYSTTTSKWCGVWCGYDSKERKQGLKNGKFILLED